MQYLGTVAFGLMTAVNIALFGLIVAAVCRRVKAHH